MNVNRFCKVCKTHVPLTDDHINGRKHQKLLQQIQRREHEEKCGIFVTGFSDSEEENQLLSYFSTFGNISRHHFDKNRKFLIIDFSHPEPVQLLLNRIFMFHGRKLIIKRKLVNSRPDRSEEDAKVKLQVLDSTRINNELKSLSANFDEQVIRFLFLIDAEKNSQEKYDALQNYLQKFLSRFFPNCKLFRFGSTVTGLNLNCSDVDIYCCINNNQHLMKQEELVKKVRNFMYKDKHFAKVFALPKARIPIVRFVHLPTQLSCDLNFRNMLGVYNSDFIAFCWTLHKHLKTAMFVIKYWAKMTGFSEGNEKFSNYLLTMLLVFYLQQKHDFPPISSLLKQCNEKDLIDNWNPHFSKSRIELTKIKETSLKVLLRGFFGFYANFDYSIYVISLYLGKPIIKVLFVSGFEQLPKEYSLYVKNVIEKGLKPLPVDKACCVQDPFELNNNIAKGITQKRLETFCTYCCFATRDFMNDSQQNSLWCLFNGKPYPFATNSDLNKPKITATPVYQVKFLQDRLKLMEINENVVKESLFSFYKDYIMNVLEKVLLLKINLKENESKGKTVRKFGQTDFCDSKDIIVASVSYECSGKFNVLDCRNVTKNLSQNTGNYLEKEIDISRILTERSNVDRAKNIVVFELTLLNKTNPIRVVLKMQKIYSESDYFQRIVNYLINAVTINILKYINDLETACTS